MSKLRGYPSVKARQEGQIKTSEPGSLVRTLEPRSLQNKGKLELYLSDRVFAYMHTALGSIPSTTDKEMEAWVPD